MLSEMEAAIHAHLTAAEDERDRYKAALEEVMAFTHPGHDSKLAQVRAWNVARRALEEGLLDSVASPRSQHVPPRSSGREE